MPEAPGLILAAPPATGGRLARALRRPATVLGLVVVALHLSTASTPALAAQAVLVTPASTLGEVVK